MIVVTGATGSIGGEVMRLLGEAARPVSRSTRPPGDLERPESLGLREGDRLLLNSSLWPGFVRAHQETIDLAAKAGVAQIVTVSVAGAEPGGLLGTGMHGEADAHLRASGIPHAILQPVGFLQNLPGLVERSDEIVGSYGEARVGYIDTRDIAAVAARILTDPIGPSATHLLTGGSAPTHAEVAAALAERLGRPITYLDLPVEQAAERLAGLYGIPVEAGLALASLMAQVGDGRWASTTSTVEDITGRAPRSLEDYLRDGWPVG
ncbi:NAD(P)H-binding protein [Nonomuraea sp. NBC_01738]|uniref:NAD(P)H-binding protein n=1 Tax=Nonomuraea sp. NBC_01738 TaxID=2976003 RepID=UPI002E0EFA82|nr:NAD(P)H-binding protein [Nonomuraea sp. NBC_01738]